MASDAVLGGCNWLPADAAAWMDAGELGDIFARAPPQSGGGLRPRESWRCAIGFEHRIRMAADRAIAAGLVLIGCAAALQHRCGPDGSPWIGGTGVRRGLI